MNDYCQHRLLVVGPDSDLKAFDRDVDWTEMTRATDIVLQKHSPTRRVWQFVTEAPESKSLRVISRRCPRLTFFLNSDCDDCRLVGLVRAKKGRLRHHRFKY
jgi:hypothetical protein